MREDQHVQWWKVPKADDPEFDIKLHRIIELLAEFMDVDPLFFSVINIDNHYHVIDQRDTIAVEKYVDPGGFLVALNDKLNWAFLTYDEFKKMFPLINTDRDLI